MNGIYLTQEGKQDIEAKIAELESINTWSSSKMQINNNEVIIAIYKTILSSATILPVEDSWNKLDYIASLNVKYPNGVIIQPKQ